MKKGSLFSCVLRLPVLSLGFQRLLLPAVTEPTANKNFGRRFGLFGDLPTRFLKHALKVTPWFLEPLLIAGWMTPLFLLAKAQRRAVISNLRHLHPQWSALRAFCGAWQVFWGFSCTHVDALRWETGTGEVDWVIEGERHFKDLAARKEGCIILTAHMGNYDLAAPMFADKFNRLVHAVRAPEREPELQKIREKELRDREKRFPNFRVLYNEADGMLGIELARVLGQGHVVAVQGDRVVSDVSPLTVAVGDGLSMRLPKGPLFLARATQVPCFPLFIIREGWRCYRIKVLPPLAMPPRRRGDDEAATRVWADTLLEIIRKHWNQWFVFESVFEHTSAGDA